MRAINVAHILLIARVFDAFSDPLVGWLSDRTQSSIGRRRPWLFAGLLPCALSYTAVFFSPELIGIDLDTQGEKLAFYMPAICLYTMLLTVYYVPYTTVIMELSDDPAERDTATTWRMTLEVFMTVVAVVMQSFVIAYLAPDSGSDGSLAGPDGGPFDYEFAVAPTPEERVRSKRIAYLSAAVLTNIIVVFPGLFTACVVKERPMFTQHKGCRIDCGGVEEREEDPNSPPLLASQKSKEAERREVARAKEQEEQSILSGLKAAWACKPYVLLNLTFLATWLSFQILAGNLVLYLDYAVDVYDQFEYILGTVMGSTVLWLLVFYKAMTMYEKRTIYFMGLACYSPFPALLFIINEQFIQQTGVWIVYVVSFGSGIGVATSFLLPWAMLPDTIDHSEVTSGLRHEGLFCALFVFFGKLAAGLGLAGSSLMLEFAGFNSEFGGVQPPAVALTLRILVGLVPMVLVCISAGLLYFYPITEARRQNTRRVLAERQAKLTKTARRGSLQQNGIPVDRTGPTGFGPADVMRSDPTRLEGVVIGGQAPGGITEPRAWGKMEGLTLGGAPGSAGSSAVVLPGAPGAQARVAGAAERPGPIAAARLAAQQQQAAGGGADAGGFTDVFVDLPAVPGDRTYVVAGSQSGSIPGGSSGRTGVRKEGGL